MNKTHCFYCSTRQLTKICPLQGAEYLIKHQTKTKEDKFVHACVYETLIRHLKNAPADYICSGIEKCANLQRMLQKVIQEKESEKALTWKRLHLLDKVASLTELEDSLPLGYLLKGKQAKEWKIKVSDNCFITFIWKEDNNAYDVDVIDKTGQKPIWLEYLAEAIKKNN